MNRPDNTLIEFADTQQTMTSLEIAEVTGKQHKDVLKAIRNMEPAWEKVTGRNFAPCMRISELANGVKKENPYYVLTKTETLYIATKFNDEARAKLVIRWEQLEHERQEQSEPVPVVAGHPAVRSTRRQLLVMLIEAEDKYDQMERMFNGTCNYTLDLMDEIRSLKLRVRQLESERKALPAQEQTYTVTQLSQEYGMKAVSFNNLLQQLGIQHNAGGCWVITPDYAGRDFTQTKQITVHDDGRAVRKPFTVWTEAGRKFIHDMLSRQGIKPVTGEGGSV